MTFAYMCYLLTIVICLHVVFACTWYLLAPGICLHVVFACKWYLLASGICLQVVFACKWYSLASGICLQVVFANMSSSRTSCSCYVHSQGHLNGHSLILVQGILLWFQFECSKTCTMSSWICRDPVEHPIHNVSYMRVYIPFYLIPPLWQKPTQCNKIKQWSVWQINH